MKRKRFLTMALAVFFGLILCTASYAADKVGYVNLQRLVNESKMGKDARDDIQKLRKEKEEVVTSKLKEVNKLKSLIDKKGAKMDPREKRDKLETYKRLVNDYQRLVADAKQDILREDRELVSIILKKADPILKKVAKKKKYTIILKDPNAIGYLDPKVDITDFVLGELDKQK